MFSIFVLRKKNYLNLFLADVLFLYFIFWYKKGTLTSNEILDKLQKLDNLNNTPKNVNMYEVASCKILKNVKSNLKP